MRREPRLPVPGEQQAADDTPPARDRIVRDPQARDPHARDNVSQNRG
jgi:hypothetical protein